MAFIRSGSLALLAILIAAGPVHGQIQLTIGVSAPLTGDLAEFGEAVRNGIQLAREELPQKLSTASFVYQDNLYDAASSVSSLQSLTQVNKIDVLYLWGEIPLHATADIIERQKLPTIAMSIDARPALGKKYTIRSINHPEQYSRLMLHYARRMGWKRLGLVTVDDPFIDALVRELLAQKLDGEQIQVFHNVLPEEQDFRSATAKLRAHDFDAIGVYLLPGQASSFCRQARPHLGAVPIFGTDVFESHNEIRNAGGGMEHSVFPAVVVPSEFHDKYKGRFGSDTQITYAYNAYAFARRTAEFLPVLQSRPSAEKLLSLYSAESSLKTYEFRSDPALGNFYEFDLALFQVRDGNFRQVQ